LAAAGIELASEQVQLLDQYCRLLWEWNAHINLTRHTDYERFVRRDVVDTLAFSQNLRPGERVLDVGSGGGVPGLVLAILRPDLQVSLAESISKKARVLADMVDRLQLPVPVFHARAETLLEAGSFDTLIVRAVAPLVKLLTWFGPHWGSFGRLLVIKGPAWLEERAEARHRGQMRTLELRRLASWPLPHIESESTLLEIRPKAESGRKPKASTRKAKRQQRRR
jgi:16S rRNA (guanine527-N7)-methyltransferase